MVSMKLGGNRDLQEVLSEYWMAADDLRLAARVIGEGILPQGACSELHMTSRCGF